jgi:hypothetical protein
LATNTGFANRPSSSSLLPDSYSESSSCKLTRRQAHSNAISIVCSQCVFPVSSS